MSSATLAGLAARAAVAEPEETIPVEAPFTGKALGSVPKPAAPANAPPPCRRQARPKPPGAPAGRRARRVLPALPRLVIARAHEALDLIQLELGKSRRHAYEEVVDTAIRRATTPTSPPPTLLSAAPPGALPLLTTAGSTGDPRASSA